MQTSIENNDIAAIIQKTGIARLYDNKSYHPKYNAQLNLGGRTHWADDSSLKFFGCRISSAHETASGLLFYVIESSFLDFHNTKRGFRYAIFDLFGECVARLDTDAAFKTSTQARKAMYSELNAFDVAAHYRRALESKTKQIARENAATRDALAQLSTLETVEA